MGNLASRGSRFGAAFVDGLLSLPFIIPGVVVAVAMGDHEGTGALVGALVMGLGLLVLASINGYFLVVAGQTIGKKLFKISIVRTDGSRVDWARILLLRSLVPTILGQLCGLFSLIDVLLIFGEERKCIHDHMADTIVIDGPFPGGAA